MSCVLLLGYIGPETILPLASVVAGIIGALLVCWRFLLVALSRVYSRVTGRKKSSDPMLSSSAPATDLPE